MLCRTVFRHTPCDKYFPKPVYYISTFYDFCLVLFSILLLNMREKEKGEDAAGTAGGLDAGADLVVAAQCFHLC